MTTSERLGYIYKNVYCTWSDLGLEIFCSSFHSSSVVLVTDKPCSQQLSHTVPYATQTTAGVDPPLIPSPLFLIDSLHHYIYLGALSVLILMELFWFGMLLITFGWICTKSGKNSYISRIVNPDNCQDYHLQLQNDFLLFWIRITSHSVWCLIIKFNIFTDLNSKFIFLSAAL